MVFVEFDMWDGGTVNNGFVITKHEHFLAHGNTKVAQVIFRLID